MAKDKLEEALLNDLDDNNKKQENTSELKQFLEKLIDGIKHIFMNMKKNKVKKKKDMIISIGVFSIFLIGFCLILGMIFIKTNKLNKETDELRLLQNYKNINLKNLELDPNKNTLLSVSDLIKKYDEYKEQNESYKKYILELQAPYKYLLQYIYLPSLNIWKDEFTGKLDISILGQKYLKKNPYEDIKLQNQWKNFFKYVGKNNEYNTINSIVIDNIMVDKDNPELFTIPIDIKFTSNTKRSFLLLLNKLSMTSNPDNIILIDEFMYYLWQSIKEQKKDVLEKIKLNNIIFSGWNDDKVIGYELYQWIKNNRNTDLVDNVLLEKMIPSLMVCGEENRELCYYRFRQKYASLAPLAYTVGIENNRNKKRDLRTFLSEIPMLMKVDDFSFDRIKNEDSIFLNNNIKYQGSMKINLYGKAISHQEVEEIAKALGKACTKETLTIEGALEETNRKISELGKITKRLDTEKIKKLWELQSVLEGIKEKMGSYQNNEKVVKLFEMYRMMRDADICEVRS